MRMCMRAIVNEIARMHACMCVRACGHEFERQCVHVRKVRPRLPKHVKDCMPCQAMRGVPMVLSGVTDGSRCLRPSRCGHTTGLASGDGRAAGRATRASDRCGGARDRLATV
eukprot:366521-Chlamydomonas_euryale.AAC.14